MSKTADEEQLPAPEPKNVREIEAALDELGRKRPEVFRSFGHEVAFCFSVVSSLLVAEFYVSGFHVVLPPIVKQLDVPQDAQTWPASVFALVVGSFLLPFGRLGDMYGGYVVFTTSLGWYFVWNLVMGFSHNYMMLIMCRALAGLGPAGFFPSGIKLLGELYRPGPRKNTVFGIYSAFAPIGFFVGIFVGGVSAEYLNWRWYFYIGTMIVALIFVCSLLSVPCDFRAKRETSRKEGLTMDWLGVATIVPALVLIVYAFTGSSSAPQGWKSPQILVCLILGFAILGVAVYVEGWVAKDPLVPAVLFAAPYMKPMLFALFISYGSFNLILYYSTFFIENVMLASPIQTAIWYLPMIIGGLLIGSSSGFTLHRLPGRVLLLISSSSLMVCLILFATMPADGNYWAWVFPAMVCCTIGVDITFTVTNVFITSSLPASKQGLAGAVINSCVFLGFSVMLAFGDIVANATAHQGLEKSYHSAFWLGAAVAAVAMVTFIFIPVESAKSALTYEEKQQRDAEASEANMGAAPETSTVQDPLPEAVVPVEPKKQCDSPTRRSTS